MPNSQVHPYRLPRGGTFPKSTQQLAIEEPLEIRLEFWRRGKFQRQSVSITMRTPGHDDELATGFLFSEGIISDWGQIKHVRSCGPPGNGQNFQNIVRVELHPGVPVKTESLARNFYTNSSCGICGKTSLEAVQTKNLYGQNLKTLSTPQLQSNILLTLVTRMTSDQHLFKQTGGSHASGLFNQEGRLLCLREDVGRHNALDKVLGWALKKENLPLHNHVLLVSGRASFELVQKAAMAGIPVLAAIGAPSTLAVQAAREFHMTLIGFLKNHHFTVFHDPGRIRLLDGKQPKGEHEHRLRSQGTLADFSMGHSPRIS